MSRSLTLHWLRGDAKGYTDEFPMEFFEKDSESSDYLHYVRGPRGGLHPARFLLKVSGRLATLDYGKFEAFNLSQVMQLGVLKFEFSDSTRRKARAARWNGRLLTAADATLSIRSTPTGQSAFDRAAERETILGRILARPQQAAFRKALEIAYGSRCCVTRCGITEPASHLHQRVVHHRVTKEVAHHEAREGQTTRQRVSADGNDTHARVAIVRVVQRPVGLAVNLDDADRRDGLAAAAGGRPSQKPSGISPITLPDVMRSASNIRIRKGLG